MFFAGLGVWILWCPYSLSVWSNFCFHRPVLERSRALTLCNMSLQPVKKQKTSASVVTPFQPKHGLQYGVKPCDHGTGGLVLGARCQFCIVFGREGKASHTCWIFKAPFRPQNYRIHLQSRHPEKWAMYQALSDDEKKLFFVVPVKAAELIEFHLQPQSTHLRFDIDKDIVETIIGRVMCNTEGCSDSNALSAFSYDEATGKYSICVKQVKQYELATRFVGRGLSFVWQHQLYKMPKISRAVLS